MCFLAQFWFNGSKFLKFWIPVWAGVKWSHVVIIPALHLKQIKLFKTFSSTFLSLAIDFRVIYIMSPANFLNLLRVTRILFFLYSMRWQRFHLANSAFGASLIPNKSKKCTLSSLLLIFLNLASLTQFWLKWEFCVVEVI